MAYYKNWRKRRREVLALAASSSSSNEDDNVPVDRLLEEQSGIPIVSDEITSDSDLQKS